MRACFCQPPPGTRTVSGQGQPEDLSDSRSTWFPVQMTAWVRPLYPHDPYEMQKLKSTYW